MFCEGLSTKILEWRIRSEHSFHVARVSEFRRSRKSEVPLRGLAFYGVRDASLATEDFQGMRPRIPWGQNAGKTAPRHDPADQNLSCLSVILVRANLRVSRHLSTRGVWRQHNNAIQKVVALGTTAKFLLASY